MDYLRELPMLGQLGNVELAKLVPDLQEITLAQGEQLAQDLWSKNVVFVRSGMLELRSEDGSRTVWLFQVRANEFCGEGALVDENDPTIAAVALQSASLVAIPGQMLAGTLGEQPQARAQLQRILLTRTQERTQDLARSRRMLAAYTGELWSQAEAEKALSAPLNEAPPVAATVMDQPLPPRRAATTRGEQPHQFALPRGVKSLLLATTVAGALALAPIPFDSSHTRYILAILLWGAVCWLFNALPDFVVALITCIALVVAGLATPSEALSGFASPTWFLLLGVWCIGVAIARTGLLYRVALYMLRLLPSSYIGQALALAITGTLVTPLLPSSQGRTVMAAPLTLELGEAMRFQPHSKGASGLAMAGFLGFGQMYFLVLNGTTTGILAWSLLPPAFRNEVSWTFWFVAALPLGLIVFGLTFWATMRLLPAESTQGISRELIATQLKVLGPLRGNERLSLAVMVFVLLAFVTAPLHHVDPAWFALAGSLFLVATNVLDKKSLSGEVDWSFLLFFGAVIGVANVARSARLDEALSAYLQPFLAPLIAHPLTAVAMVGLLTIVIRLAVSPLQAIPLLTIVMIPIFTEAGYNPFAAVLTIMAASTTFAVPLLSPGYSAMLAGTRERMFTQRQILPLALLHSGILLLGLLASVPYWLLLRAL